ncbi:uncharacterized protein LOC8259447 [Ricinus communis]|uniref:uncharacterized protein LOC8259447 n=1 Tax=Ricinus communis TaxID=3988 RepID=UPI00201A629D|nr:uncharacterized protein LOC8259447 [Ricinus communis]
MKKYLSSTWLSAAGRRTTKKLHVKVKPLKLEGVNNGGTGDDHEKKRMVVIEMKWKGPNYNKSMLFLPFQKGFLNKCQKNYSSHRYLKNGDDIEWDEEFENVCSFLMGSEDNKNCFRSWHVSFKILYGEDAKAKTKLVEMGTVSLNIAELASSMIDSEIEKKLPVSLKIDEVAVQATLSVCISFAQVRISTDSLGIVQNSAVSDYEQPISKIARSQTLPMKKIHKENPVSSSDWIESAPLNSADSPGNEALPSSKNDSSETQLHSDLKVKFWKKKRWGFTLSKRKREPSTDKTNKDNNFLESQISNSHDWGSWEIRELASREGQTKLKTNVFFASFDQRSEKAAGESACATVVAVIAHWLQSNQDFMPTTSQFDSLIAEGSFEWRKLCNNDAYMKSFPDNHFDLETVLKAELRPVNILSNKSFTGIFSPEKFENLQGAKSFDDIWEEISSITKEYDQRIYIVSWNDHFFVLKADANSYYIIDSLGERLFEGCNQAYILKFDESTLMYGKAAKEVNSEEKVEEAKEEEESEEIICKGKECCKEFIKRFLAAILIRELEEQDKKGSVSTFSLLQRLQIDFHYCSSSSSSSVASPTSSIFSSEG